MRDYANSLPTPTMAEALIVMHDKGGLVRHQGGFWAPAGATRDHNGLPQPYFGTSTVEGCVRRGRAVYTAWRDGRSGRFPVKVEFVPPDFAA